MSSFLAQAFSYQKTVRADDDDMCYDFAPVDPGGRELCLGPYGLTHSLNSLARPRNVNCDWSLTRTHPNKKQSRTSPRVPHSKVDYSAVFRRGEDLRRGRPVGA
jgi:hypothetical protein